MLIALTGGVWAISAVVIDPATVDPFYRRFTTPRASSLILGSSRAAQGLRPSAFASMDSTYHTPFNFAFTVLHSPYGEAYLQLIEKKMRPGGRSLFILEVNPWTLSARKEGVLRESRTFTRSIIIVNNLSPNVDYLLRSGASSPSSHLWSSWRPSGQVKRYLHPNGWFEVDMKEPATREKIAEKIADYRGHTEVWENSAYRWHYLRKTVDMLSSHGRVVLLRLPVSPEMRALEGQYMPDFDARVQRVADASDVTYINLISASGEYRTTDGNHLWKPDILDLTERVEDSVAAKPPLQ